MRRTSALPGETWAVDTLSGVIASRPILHDGAAALASAGIAATGVAIAAGALVLGYRQGRSYPVLVAIGSAAVAYALAHVMKSTLGRVAPYPSRPSHHAFPEGPGAFTAALAVSLAPRFRTLAEIAAVMTVVDGVCQVALRYHWPSDVLVAWALGAACALAASRLARL